MEFRCHAPSAMAVFLAGSCNDWDARQTPLSRDGNGDWSVVMHLPPGFYHYKYVIDGRWCCEPNCPPGCTGNAACDHCVPNCYGTMDRVRIVG
jgi:1,4-alpha-glucan branching enzyme